MGTVRHWTILGVVIGAIGLAMLGTWLMLDKEKAQAAPVKSEIYADAGPDRTVSGPSPVSVQFDGSESYSIYGDITSYKWYNQWGLLRAEGAYPVIDINFGYEDPKPGTTRKFKLVVADAHGNKAEDWVIITIEDRIDYDPLTEAVRYEGISIGQVERPQGYESFFMEAYLFPNYKGRDRWYVSVWVTTIDRPEHEEWLLIRAPSR